ncbi:MAG: TonB family protein, partial [Veillonella parvula]
SGTGDGTGEGDGHGTGKAAFNVEGFYAAVDSQKQIPYAAIKRKMNVDVTINVMAKLDTNGNLIDVYPTSGGDEIFVEAALDAVRRATPYPNETGDIQPVEVPVHFVVQADGEDEEE